MRRLVVLVLSAIASLFAVESSNAQEIVPADSLIVFKLEINPVTIVATQTAHRSDSLPFSTTTIQKIEQRALSIRSSDEVLKIIPGTYIDRTWGVFSKNSGVSMRGLDGNNRVLIMLDGAPLNKSSYGMVTWNMVSPEQIESVDVVAGPSSSVYGNNAMTGVIGINTIKPKKPLEGAINLSGGEFGLKGISGRVGGRLKSHRFYWDIAPSYQEGDGYFIDPVDLRDSTSAKVYVVEKRLSLRAGGRIKPGVNVTASYTIYEDKRGAGKKVYLSDGNYDSYFDQSAQVSINVKKEAWTLTGRVYLQTEHYKKQSESINKLGDTYKLSYTFQNSDDAGIWVASTFKKLKVGQLTSGVEMKYGRIDAHDSYRTSTDDIFRSGNMVNFGAFIQDELFLGKSTMLTGGLRFDVAEFYDGQLNVKDPTKATGFSSNINQQFAATQWYDFSPRVGVKQYLSSKVSLNAALSSGFMPAKLDDLCSTRKITKGFKIANPNLKPETLISSEFGVSYNPNKELTVNITGYYSYGINFQYFVATGDSIDTGGSDRKPVLMRDNVGEVVVKGAELAVRWQPYAHWLVRANGSASTSEIVKFKSPIAATNLKGMAITEVPDYLASVGVVYLGGNRSVGLTFSHVGRQWIDDVNTQRLSDYQTFDLHLEQTLVGGLRAWLDVQNLFNQIYVDKKGMNCPGRFVLAGLRFEF